MGQLPQLERQRHDRDLAAQAVDELAEPEHPELAVALDGLQVDEETPQASPMLATRLGHGGKDRRSRIGRATPWACEGGRSRRTRTRPTGSRGTPIPGTGRSKIRSDD